MADHPELHNPPEYLKFTPAQTRLYHDAWDAAGPELMRLREASIAQSIAYNTDYIAAEPALPLPKAMEQDQQSETKAQENVIEAGRVAQEKLESVFKKRFPGENSKSPDWESFVKWPLKMAQQEGLNEGLNIAQQVIKDGFGAEIHDMMLKSIDDKFVPPLSFPAQGNVTPSLPAKK